MTTLSVPLPAEMAQAIEKLVKEGKASTKSELVRQALSAYLEDQAVQAVLKAGKEPNLKGNLDALAEQL